MSFDELVIDTETNGEKTMMISASENSAIGDLQQGILTALTPYRDFVHREAEEWETKFKPHITIAADLNPEKYEQARTGLGVDYLCEGVIRELVLIVADKATPEEAGKSENQTVNCL